MSSAQILLQQLTRRLKRLSSQVDSRSELGRLARDLGHALPAAEVALVRDLRAEIAALEQSLGKAGPAGEATARALSALSDLLGGYAAEREEAASREELTQAAGQGLRAALLARLGTGDRRPGELARELGKREDQVSRTLRELRALGLVEVAPPGPLDDNRVRLHRLTLEGRRATQGLAASKAAEFPAVASEPAETAVETADEEAFFAPIAEAGEAEAEEEVFFDFCDEEIERMEEADPPSPPPRYRSA